MREDTRKSIHLGSVDLELGNATHITGVTVHKKRITQNVTNSANVQKAI